MSRDQILEAVDGLLARAAASPDEAPVLMQEATKMLRQLREQQEVEAMPEPVRWLYRQMDNVQ